MGRDYGGHGSSAEQSESLLAGSSSRGEEGPLHFVPFGQRTRKDSVWTLAWVSVYMLSIVAGILTFLNRNVDFATQMTPEYLSDPSHCPADQLGGRRSLLGFRSMDEGSDPTKVDNFLSQFLFWLLGSVVGALLVGMAFILMVTHSPKLLLGLALGVQVGVPLTFFTAAALQGQAVPAIPLIVLAALLVFVFWLWRDQLGLVVQLMGVSGKGLAENLGLVGAILGIQFMVLLLMAPLLVTFAAALTNGHVVYNSDRVPGEECVDASGRGVLCCQWQLDDHVWPVISFSSFVLLWTSFIGNEVRTFTVSGAIAQWYFAPVSEQQRKSGGRVGRSLWAALGSSFGSLCFGALVLTIVSMLRASLDKLRRNAQNNIVFICLFYIAEFMMTVLELVTKFATVRLAITGERFWDATCNTTGLLKRNFLDTFGVWWFPPMILQTTSVVLSLVWAFATYSFTSAAWQDLEKGNSYAIGLAVISFVLTWIVLSFLISLLLNIIDAVYICFAMDRDSQSCSRVDIHDVYTKLPSVGQVVQNPDGGYAYARPGASP